MSRLSPRKDRETAAQIDAALVLQQACGDEAARAFLARHGVRRELTERALTAPPDQRRENCALLGQRA